MCGIKFSKYSLDLFPHDVNSARENGMCQIFIHNHFKYFLKISESDFWLRLVTLSVCLEPLGFHWMDFHEI